MIPLPNPCPECHKSYTNVAEVGDGLLVCPNCRNILGQMDKVALSVDFSTALQLINLGYRMRYEDWPADDYCMVSNRGTDTLYRFNSNLTEEPDVRLPWITTGILNGKWYFASRKET